MRLQNKKKRELPGQIGKTSWQNAIMSYKQEAAVIDREGGVYVYVSSCMSKNGKVPVKANNIKYKENIGERFTGTKGRVA